MMLVAKINLPIYYENNTFYIPVLEINYKFQHRDLYESQIFCNFANRNVLSAHKNNV